MLPSLDGVAALPDATCTTLREVCERAGYTEDTLRVTADVPRTIQGAAHPLVRRALLAHPAEDGGKSHTAGVLALLFAYEDDVDESTVRASMGAPLVDALLASGFIERSPVSASVRSSFRCVPLDGLWLLADHPTGGPDAVMPPGPTTAEIVAAMPAQFSGRVLDVGCGPGSLAMIAARRGASYVTGIDINPRAIRMAEFNARLNGLAGLRFAVGNLLEPVRGERFDMVVAQPPYVVQPPGSTPIAFLHGGPTGEEITLRILAGLPDLLAPDARALVLVDAPIRTSEPLHQRYRKQFGSAPVDLLVLSSPGSSPNRQAAVYAGLEAPEGGPEYADVVARYADHFDQLGIREFTHALVVMRAHSHGHRFAATIPIKPSGAPGTAAAIDALLASLDVASLTDDALAGTRLRASRFARWIEERPAPHPSAEPTHAVRFSSGRLSIDIDDLSASAYQLAGLVDGAPSVEDAAREYARISGIQWLAARAQMLRFVREALGRGLLESRP